MKRLFSAVLCFCFLYVLMTPAFAAETDLYVDERWTILIPRRPTTYERFASEKLSSVLSEVFGTRIQVSSAADAPYIALGSASETDISGIADNGYRIEAIGENIHIGGTGARGLQVGVYRFLEEFCGRKVYTSEVTELPAAEQIRVPADTDIVYEPYFEYTETDWRTSNIAEYSMANGLYGGIYRTLPSKMGGTVQYLAFAHTMQNLCQTEKYAQSHPEYLALHNGVRTTAQPCLTNPDVLRITTENVLNLLAEKHDPSASLQIVSVSQNDNYDYCECEKCKAFEEAHGGAHSSVVLNFVNQIADVVRENGYDNVAVDTFAYQYTRQAPVGIVPRDNVIVRLCTIECCFSHTLDDPSCSRNAAFMRDLHDWSEICGRLYIWDYTTNYANTCLVFPDFGVIRRNIQVFYEHNVKGVYEEGNFYLHSCDTEFGDLRMYMIAKCLQDPYRPLGEEIDGFLAAFYGDGWIFIRRAIDLYTTHAGDEKEHHLGIYYNAKKSMHFTNREISLIDDCWKHAKAAATSDVQRERVARSEISWRFWKASVHKGEFSLCNPDRFAEKETLFSDLKAYGVTTISEGGSNDYFDCICIKYAPADAWNAYEAESRSAQRRAFFGDLLERWMPILTGFGILYTLFRWIYSI